MATIDVQAGPIGRDYLERKYFKHELANMVIKLMGQREQLVGMVEELLEDAERMGPPAPDHICGPDQNCDGNCMDFAHFSEGMTKYRKVLKDVKDNW